MMGRGIELYSTQDEIDQRGEPARTPTDTDNLNWQTDYAAVTAHGAAIVSPHYV
jgi:hypothetical protein